MPIDYSKELRNLEDLPEWKRRAIEKQRKNEERLAEEQNARDYKHGTGIYNPETAARLKQQQAAQAQEKINKETRKIVTANPEQSVFMFEYDPAHPLGLASNRDKIASVTPTPSLSLPSKISDTMAVSNFWEAPEFSPFVEKLQTTNLAATAKEDGIMASLKEVFNVFKALQESISNSDNPSRTFREALYNVGQEFNREYSSFTGGDKSTSVILGDQASLRNSNAQYVVENGQVKINPFRLEEQTMTEYSLPVQQPKYLGLLNSDQKFATDQTSNREIFNEMAGEIKNPVVSGAVKFLGNSLGGVLDWMQRGTDIQSKYGDFNFVLGGSMEEEFIMQNQENLTPGQRVLQHLAAGLQLGVDGWVSLVKRTRDLSLRDTTGVKAAMGRKTISEEEYQRRQDENWKVIETSWSIFVDSWNAMGESLAAGQHAYHDTQTPYPGFNAEAQKEKWYTDTQTRAEWAQRSKNNAGNAYNLWSQALRSTNPTEQNQLFAQALDFQKMSIEDRRKSDPFDSWGAATWSREPERYNKFLEDAAYLELQLGRPLSDMEIRRLKDFHTNMETEIVFQLVFDVTNLAGFMDAPMKGLSNAIKETPKFIEVAGKLDDAAKLFKETVPAVKWLTDLGVSSRATKIANAVQDLSGRMLKNAYDGNIPALIEDMPKIEGVVKSMRAAETSEEAYKIYKAALDAGELAGVQELSYWDFKKLMDLDVGSMSKPWGDTLSEAAANLEASLAADIRKKSPTMLEADVNRLAAQQVQQARYSNHVLNLFSGEFGKAYTDTHRVLKGSVLMDDSILGNIAKWGAELTGGANQAKKLNPDVVFTAEKASEYGGLRKVIADALEIGNLDPETKFGKMLETYKNSKTLDEILLTLGYKWDNSSKLKKVLNFALVDVIEGWVTFTRMAKNAWMSMVLTTPRWIINNVLDSTTRAWMYGGDPFADIFSITFGLQTHLFDDIGIVPPAAMQSNIVRSDLGYMDSVSNYVMFRGDENTFGIFTYWNRERERIKQAAQTTRTIKDLKGLEKETAQHVMDLIARDAPKTASRYSRVWDGLASAFNELKYGVQAMSGAVTDFQSAVEFTLRSRLLHKEYFKTLSELEPEYRYLGMEKLNPLEKKIAEEIWVESNSSPARLVAMTEEMLNPEAAAKTNWTSLLPSDFMMDTTVPPELRQTFTYNLKQNLTRFYDDVFQAEGRAPTPAEWEGFVTRFKKGLQDEEQAVLAQARINVSGMDTSINPQLKVNPAPKFSELKGSSPQQIPGYLERDLVADLEKKPFKKFNAEQVQESYTTLASKYGQVKTVRGAGIEVVQEGSNLVFQIGEDTWKKSRQEVMSYINNATADYIVKHNLGLSSRWAKPVTEIQYKALFQTFLSDPSKVMAENKDAFISIVRTLEGDSDLKRLLEFSSKNGIASYDGAYSLYDKALVSSRSERYLLGMSNEEIKAATARANDAIRTPSFERRFWANEHIKTAGDMWESINALGDENLKAATNNYQRMRYQVHANMWEFSLNTYPGPKALTGDASHLAWDAWEGLMADSYKVQSEIEQDIIRAFDRSPEEGIKTFNYFNDNFRDEYVKRLGFEVMWTDETKTDIARIRSTAISGTPRTIYRNEHAYVNFIAYMYPELNEGTGAVFKSAANPDIPLRRRFATMLNETFGTSTEQSMAWTRMMENHANRWSEMTGQSVEDYFNKFNFSFEGSKIPTGYVERNADGTVTFYASGKRDLTSLIRGTSTVFLDDMVEMSKYNKEVKEGLKALKALNESGVDIEEYFTKVFMEYMNVDQIENMKMKPLFSKFKEWLADDYAVLRNMTDAEELSPEVYKAMGLMYTDSSKTRESVNAKIFKNIEKNLGEAEASIKKAAQDVLPKTTDKALEGLPQLNSDLDEILKPAIEKLKTRGQMSEITRFQEMADTLKAFNDLPDKSMEDVFLFNMATNDFINQIDELMNYPTKNELVSWGNWGKNLKNKEERVYALGKAMLEGNGYSKAQINAMTRTEFWDAVETINNRVTRKEAQSLSNVVREMIDEFRNVRKPVNELTREEIEQGALRAGRGAEFKASMMAGKPGEEYITEELQTAWDVWKQKRGIAALPADVLDNPDNFKEYLRFKIKYEPSEISAGYERMLADWENMELRILKDEDPFPNPNTFQVDSGTRSFLRQQEQSLEYYEQYNSELDRLTKYLGENGYERPALTQESQNNLREWMNTAREAKANLTSIVLDGGKTASGRTVPGAIKMVNDVMLDYNSTTRMDNIMKNLFPFWMFPSRSVPFWVKTAITHPQLISFYNKMNNWSNAFRTQAGAVTSTGKPLSSLAGYLPLGDTGMWFNPQAAMSYKYVLGVGDFVDNLTYQQTLQGEEEIDPATYAAQFLMESGPVFGFSVPPWIAYILKNGYNLSDSAIPNFPMAPELSLLPYWVWDNLAQWTSKITLFGSPFGANVISPMMNAMYPHASFQEALIETKIYENALQEMQKPGADKEAILQLARDAVMVRDGSVDVPDEYHLTEERRNAAMSLWDGTYKDLTNDQAKASAASFFTGFYPKEFTDARADLYALRDKQNSLRSAMNNELQANVMGLDPDAAKRWQAYIDLRNSPEGKLYGLYTDSNWIRNDNNQLVTDPIERAAYLAQSIIEEQRQMNYYAGLNQLIQEREQKLTSLPIGASGDIVSNIYDEFNIRLEMLKDASGYKYTPNMYGNDKPAELIAADLRDDFYSQLLSTKPTYRKDLETFNEYLARVDDWEKNVLPVLAPRILSRFQAREDIHRVLTTLRPQQQGPITNQPGPIETMLRDLGTHLTYQDLVSWQKENYDIYDVLNQGWDDLYWTPYWNTINSHPSGPATDLAKEDFMRTVNPPTAQELYVWVRENYGDRFSYEQIKQYVEGSGVSTVTDRIMATTKAEQLTKNDIYDMLSWLGPSRDTDLMQYLGKALDDAGYQTTRDIAYDLVTGLKGYTPEELSSLLASMKQVYANKDIQKPNRAQMVQFLMAKESNEQFKELVNKDMARYGTADMTPYELIQELQGSYFQVENSKVYTRQWKLENPGGYEILQEYWNRKRAYGRTDPVWNTYYNMDQDKGNVPGNLTALFGLDPSQGKNYQYQTGNTQPAQTPNTTPITANRFYTTKPTVYKESASKDASGISISGNGTTSSSGDTSTSNGVFLSNALKNAMGTLLVKEVNGLVFDGKPLSNPAVNFLTNLKNNHPEWAGQISQILTLNNTH